MNFRKTKHMKLPTQFSKQFCMEFPKEFPNKLQKRFQKKSSKWVIEYIKNKTICKAVG